MEDKILKIKEDTYRQIIRKGGETYDDALRRIMKLPPRKNAIEVAAR